MEISIIVATYNRGGALMATLRSLANSQIPSNVEWEVLIVDNHSTDRTRSMVEAFIGDGNFNFHYIFEAQRGKSIALNSGIGKSLGKIVAITDDDCIVDIGWVQSILGEYAADASLAMLGGRVELYDCEDKAMSVRTSNQRLVVSLAPFEPSCPSIIGCNLAFKRDVLSIVGNFDPSLGPGSRWNLVAEDMDFLYRAHRRALKIVYSPDVLVYHNHGRRMENEWKRVRRNYLSGRGAFYCKYILRGDRDVLRLAYWEVVASIKETGRRVLNRQSGLGDHLSCLAGLMRGAFYRVTEELRLGATSRKNGL